LIPIKKDSLSRAGHKLITNLFGPNVSKFIDQYVNIKILGEGAFGTVFLGTYSNGKKEVIKIQDVDRTYNFEHEYKMGIKFGRLGISPKMISKHKFSHGKYRFGIYKMGLIDGTLDKLLNRNATKELIDYVFNEIMNLLAYMCEHNLIHGDFHPGNIGYLAREDKSGNVFIKFQVIDHGYACCVKGNYLCEPDLEVSQLIRCINTTDLTYEMRIYFTQKLLDFYMINYNTGNSIPEDFKIKTYKDLVMVISRFTKKYIDLHDIYIKTTYR
jgi:serine/threonine protein kinase